MSPRNEVERRIIAELIVQGPWAGEILSRLKPECFNGETTRRLFALVERSYREIGEAHVDWIASAWGHPAGPNGAAIEIFRLTYFPINRPFEFDFRAAITRLTHNA